MIFMIYHSNLRLAQEIRESGRYTNDNNKMLGQWNVFYFLAGCGWGAANADITRKMA